MRTVKPGWHKPLRRINDGERIGARVRAPGRGIQPVHVRRHKPGFFAQGNPAPKGPDCSKRLPVAQTAKRPERTLTDRR